MNMFDRAFKEYMDRRFVKSFKERGQGYLPASTSFNTKMGPAYFDSSREAVEGRVWEPAKQVSMSERLERFKESIPKFDKFKVSVPTVSLPKVKLFDDRPEYTGYPLDKYTYAPEYLNDPSYVSGMAAAERLNEINREKKLDAKLGYDAFDRYKDSDEYVYSQKDRDVAFARNAEERGLRADLQLYDDEMREPVPSVFFEGFKDVEGTRRRLDPKDYKG